MDKKQLKMVEDALSYVANKGWTIHGSEFLKNLCKFLADTFSVDYALIDKYSTESPSVASTVAVYSKSGFLPNMEYDLAETPCNNVIGCRMCVYPSGVQDEFPDDLLLVEMNVDGYIGIPLWSSEGEPIGLIALLNSKPLIDIKTFELVLQIVAVKAAHELEKMIYENKLSLQIQELQTSEEEIRAANEELHSTTEALRESNEKLRIAKEKAEESDRLKTEFINNLSHEIRTPMNGILGFSGLLSDPDLSHEKRKNYVKIVNNSGLQLIRIIDDLLEISRLGTNQVSTEMKEVCINDLLLELFLIFDINAKEKKLLLHFNKGLTDEESVIYTDPGKLNKIISNLLDNALKFTSVGFVELGYVKLKNRLNIYVKDTGVGIKKTNQINIFDRFSQEEKSLSQKSGGLGLGLSIAQKNAELINGSISLISEKGKGSTFIVSIPYNPVRGMAEMTPVDGVDESLKYSFLIAEDDDVNYLYIEILLKERLKLNCDIKRVVDGQEAVSFCKRYPSVDIVLMDVKMPRMNGFQAAQEIRKENKKVLIIAQTAYSTQEDIERALAIGCNDFIAKPIKENEFCEMISKYLELSPV